MRVAMIDPSLFTIPYDRSLIGGLLEAGHEVTLHGRAPGRDDNDVGGINLVTDFYQITSSNAASHLPRPVKLGLKGLDHIVSMLRLRTRLRSEPPNVVHFQWLPLPMIDRRLLSGFRKIAPLVLTVHDTNPFNGDPSAALQTRGFAGCLAAFDQLIVHTQQGRERLRGLGIPESRIAVLPFGLMEELPPAPVPAAAEGPVTFLLFGKLKPYKGADVMIEAFARMPEALRARASLRVVGKAYMPLEPLRQLAEERGVADKFILEPRFVGDDEVNALFSPDVVAVFPYREIEASAVLPFALANGRPVIASAIGNFAEAIDDGVQGLLVPPDDPAALSDAMARMITDRAFAAQCGRRSREMAEAVPNWLTIAEQTAAVYDLAGSEDRARTVGAAH